MAPTSGATLITPIPLPGLVVPGNLFLAPLAGYSDIAFRGLCIEGGASFTFSEMVSCEGILRENEGSLRLMRYADEEELLGIQIFSGSPEVTVDALPILLDNRPSLIDLNCGCPVPKIVKNGAGAALTREPKNLERVVKAIVDQLKVLGVSVPVSVKIRSGWDSNSITYIDAASRAVDAGASLITLHPRTRAQGYSGRSDWSQIARLKELLPVPVIGSGDLFSPEDAVAMLTQTGCDGVMFARGAIGDPTIFERTARLITTGSVPPSPTPKERLELALRHLEREIQLLGEEKGCKEIRKHLASYTKGVRGGGSIRSEIVRASTYREYRAIFDRVLSTIQESGCTEDNLATE